MKTLALWACLALAGRASAEVRRLPAAVPAPPAAPAVSAASPNLSVGLVPALPPPILQGVREPASRGAPVEPVPRASAVLDALAAQPEAAAAQAAQTAFDGAATPRALETAASAAPLAPADDARATGMKAALDSIRGKKAGQFVELAFRPSPASLRALAKFDTFEALLARRRTGGWILVRGEVKFVNIPDGEDLDVFIHNHFYHPVLQKSFVPWPSEADLTTSAEHDAARWYVVSDVGLVEWDPTHIPLHPNKRPNRGPGVELFKKGDDRAAWRSRFMFGSPWRIAAQIGITAVYKQFLDASGIDAWKYRWRDVTQELIERPPR